MDHSKGSSEQPSTSKAAALSQRKVVAMETSEESSQQPSTSKAAALLDRKVVARESDEELSAQPSTSKAAAFLQRKVVEMETSEESFQQPSTSKIAAFIEAEGLDDANETLPPTLKDEEDEILRLESEIPKRQSDKRSDDDERDAKIKFHCTVCDMQEMVHYYGETPPFAYGIKFIEDTYVMRDPFQPPPPRGKPKAEYFIAMGANCSKCQKCVCRECSLFYTRTFCLGCAEKQLKIFPVEIQTKLRKQLAAKQDS